MILKSLILKQVVPSISQRMTPSYYDSSGFKGRRYKGSSKPKDVPTFLWRGASKAARERAKREALLKEVTEKHDAAVAKERKYNRLLIV